MIINFFQKVHYHSKVWSQFNFFKGAIKIDQNEQSKDTSLWQSLLKIDICII